MNRTQTQVDIISQNALTNAVNHVGNLLKTNPDMFKGKDEKEIANETAQMIIKYQNHFRNAILQNQ